VISADLDFPRLLALAGATGPGLILLRSGNYSEAESLECIRRVLMSVPAEDLPSSIVVVDHKSVRRRLLPIQILPNPGIEARLTGVISSGCKMDQSATS
jgi:hypothetical protein